MPFTRSLLLLVSATIAASIPISEEPKLDPSVFANTRCSDSPKLGTPTYGDKGIVFTVCSEREIAAPILDVYNALLDFSEYKNWNSFVVEVVAEPGGTQSPPGPREVGFEMTFITAGLLPGLNTTSGEIVTFTETDVLGDGSVAFVGWKFDGFGQLAEHPNVLVDLGNGKTRYTSWETFYGLIAPVTAILKKNLVSQFEAQADDLKALVEGGGTPS